LSNASNNAFNAAASPRVNLSVRHHNQEKIEMLRLRSLVVLALCGCFLQLAIGLAAPQESIASPMNAQNKIKIDEDINELRRIPYRYTPASAADVTNGRLAELLALHSGYPGT
jgi:hypothetical protein